MNIMLNEDIIMYLDPSQFSERVGKIFKGNVYEYIESKIYRYKVRLFGFIPLGTVKLEGAVRGKIYIKLFNKIKIIKLTHIR